jgi:two-component system sensor histidine kinase UhpB
MNKKESSSGSLLDLVLHNIEEFFILVNKDLRILLLNIHPPVNSSFPIQPELRTGIVLTDIPRLEPRKEDIIDCCKKALDGIETEIESEYQMGDGTYRYFRSVFKPATNHSGKVEAVMITIKDVTENKFAAIKQLKEELNRQKIISQAIIDTQEYERTEIGKELHDNVNQLLAATKLNLETAKSNTSEIKILLEKSISNINAAIEEIRKIAGELTSYSINDIGLVTSIMEVAENINMSKTIRVNVYADKFNEEQLGDNQKLMFFRIVQEALNNIIKHSFATSVDISITEESGKILLSIKDNGKGFDVSHTKKGIGVHNIQNRVSMFNGSLLLNSAPGQGCELRVEIPVVGRAV